MFVIKRNGNHEPVDFGKIEQRIRCHANDLLGVDPSTLAQKVISSMKQGMHTQEIDELCGRIAAGKGIYHPDNLVLAARIEVSSLHKTTEGDVVTLWERMAAHSPAPLIDPQFLPFLKTHHTALQHALDDGKSDFDISYFGLKTLMKSYLLTAHGGELLERPCMLFLRVAVQLHAPDIDKVLECYGMLSRREIMHATPTLFNAASLRPQLSSCFLLAMQSDSIDGIFDTLKQCARISKYAGGIGVAISNIRGNGSYIKSTGGTSNGILPMLRMYNNAARYVDQTGRRKGSFAMYLEPWHVDVMSFLEAKLPHGNVNARAHDLFYGLWVCDLFMQRVQDDQDWSLFCPNDLPEPLDEVYGETFERLYEQYEAEGRARTTMKARDLFFKILQSQVESGTPYMLYKDAVNKKSNQQNLGCCKSSNLCCEITLFTSPEEVAVCNLASICLPKMLHEDGAINFEKLGATVEAVVENLDNVIDKNFYPVDEARTSNERHRPIGIGVQGLASALMIQHLPFESEEALAFSRDVFECIYYHALRKSNMLAKTRGPYSTFAGSPASRGVLQYDMWGNTAAVEASARFEWRALKHAIVQDGLRHSMLLAPMPTASSSQIAGNSEGIDPLTSNLYTRHTLAGDFVCVNEHLVHDLINNNLWDDAMQKALIKARGSVQHIERIPRHLKDVYKTVWEIKQRSVIDAAAARGQFVCQSQSMNLFFAKPDVNTLSSAHLYAWKKGLKTGMYYLRSQAAADGQSLSLEQESSDCETCGS